ncbi:hypothetical protein SLE2022_149030 [Rubroshorea leprosula]
MGCQASHEGCRAHCAYDGSFDMLAEHGSRSMLHSMHHAVQIDRHQLLQLFPVLLSYAASKATNTGIAEHDVQFALPCNCQLHSRFHISFLCYIAVYV